MATFNAMGDLGAGLGSIIMGFVLQISSYRTMFLCLVFTAIINVVLFSPPSEKDENRDLFVTAS